MIQGFLWILLGIVVLTVGLNLVLDGAGQPDARTLIPNIAFAGVIGLALWLNWREHMNSALAIIFTVILGMALLQVVVAGLEGTELILFLLFVPTVLAGLLLDRRALYLVSGVGLGVVLVTLFLQLTGRHPQALADPEFVRATTLQFALIFVLVVFFLDRFGLSLNEALTVSAQRDVALSREVTDRRQAEAELRGANDRIESLNVDLEGRLAHLTSLREIDKAITGNLDLNLTLDVALTQVTDRLGVDAAAVLLYNPTLQTLAFATGRGFRTAGLRDLTVRLGEGLAGRAAELREPVELHGGDKIDELFLRRQGIEDEEVESYVAVPLIARGQVQGVLELFQRSYLASDADWHDFLDTFAVQTAIALDNATLFENLEQSNDELRLAYDATIEGWARALDQRDRQTEGHSRRTTDLTLALARRMGLVDEELVHVRRGALLHDIGKIGVPDSILLKPGKLAPDEWEIMRQHPTFARDLLEPIAFLRPALEIPYLHHERWNGSGYPLGLEGEDIPLAARVFAVIDVYDALTSDRPYREAWSEERALEYIQQGAGTDFDPAVVAEFIGLVGSLEPGARSLN